jgi:hypothetical protein
MVLTRGLATTKDKTHYSQSRMCAVSPEPDQNQVEHKGLHNCPYSLHFQFVDSPSASWVQSLIEIEIEIHFQDGASLSVFRSGGDIAGGC